ncbi:unnamed protein product [Phytophthora lilii]|uniref:Unnamed protein product n=1 Tax=Phytophthora lilii TaxID=2077276 RepID=A0A9W6YL67_9STRA|nr:unnamed protein product [Phytophthora lilii]
MLDAETNMKNLDTEDQVEARSWVKNLFNANPNCEGGDAFRTRRRLEDSLEFDTSTSTSSDQRDRKYRLLWILLNNKSLLESAGLQKALEPVLKGDDHKLPLVIDKDSYVWIDGSSVSVFGKDSGRLSRLSPRKDFGKYFTPGEGESRHGVLSGIDEDMDKTLTNADNHAEEILTNYYKKLQEDDVKIPFRLNPIVDTKDGVKPHPSYYFGQPTVLKTFNIRNDQVKPISGDGLKYLMKTIRWMDTSQFYWVD